MLFFLVKILLLKSKFLTNLIKSCFFYSKYVKSLLLKSKFLENLSKSCFLVKILLLNSKFLKNLSFFFVCFSQNLVFGFFGQNFAFEVKISHKSLIKS